MRKVATDLLRLGRRGGLAGAGLSFLRHVVVTVGEAFRASASEVGPKRGLIEVGRKKGVIALAAGHLPVARRASAPSGETCVQMEKSVAQRCLEGARAKMSKWGGGKGERERGSRGRRRRRRSCEPECEAGQGGNAHVGLVKRGERRKEECDEVDCPAWRVGARARARCTAVAGWGRRAEAAAEARSGRRR